REEELSLRPEALRQRARRHAGFGCDLGKRELARGEPVRRAMRGGEDFLVTDLSRARAHGLDVSKWSYSLKLNANELKTPAPSAPTPPSRAGTHDAYRNLRRRLQPRRLHCAQRWVDGLAS